jgi:hypothetical protein
MTRLEWWYLATWGLACLSAVLLMVRRRSELELFRSAYWRLLLQPWKLVTFAIAGGGLILMAPYTGDPTWDYFDGAFMSVLTFVTAPWSVGVLYRAAQRRTSTWKAFVAACVWLFSASWSYDLYLVLRDDSYPLTWWSNMVLSSCLYAAAGLLWSLEWRADRGAVFGFMESTWPDVPPSNAFAKVFWFAILFMGLAAGITIPFLL